VSVSLADVPVVDAHLHPWRNADVLARDPELFVDRATMMGMCLVSSGLVDRVGAGRLRAMSDATPFALAFTRRLAAHLGCEPTREAVTTARFAAYSADPAGYLGGLWRDANVAAVICDEGYPQPTIPIDEFRADAGLQVHRVWRLEPAVAALRADAGTYGELEAAVSAAAEQAAAEGAIAFKSVLAYRTGLDVGEPSRDDAGAAYLRWREAGFPETRELAKPVRDRLMWRLFEVAAATDRPVHIHCGGGDPDVVLEHARAVDLFPFLHRHLDQRVLLIHSGQPWVEEGAAVAQILPNVHLELSVTMPWASLALDAKVEAILGVSPTNKVLYGSDESTEPEVLWFSAHVGRACVERIFARGVEQGWLTEDEAVALGAGVLGGNALRLHGLA
jgi:hypothetical protein